MDIETAVRVTEFWSFVDRKHPNVCWPWMAYQEDGYGRFFFGGRMRPAHELALTFATGEVRGESLDTCHSCNNPICCNPRHLRFDTRASNVADSIKAGTFSYPPRKLSADDVRTIRDRAALGARQKDLAAQYGVVPATVSMVVRGLRWPDAGGPITNRKAS